MTLTKDEINNELQVLDRKRTSLMELLNRIDRELDKVDSAAANLKQQADDEGLEVDKELIALSRGRLLPDSSQQQMSNPLEATGSQAQTVEQSVTELLESLAGFSHSQDTEVGEAEEICFHDVIGLIEDEKIVVQEPDQLSEEPTQLSQEPTDLDESSDESSAMDT